jgi:uncharacterized protein (TIRG00374 family)
MPDGIGRRYWNGLIFALVLSVGGLALVGAFTSGEILTAVLAQARGAFFYLAAGLVVGLWLLEGLRTKAILEITGSRIGFWPAVEVQLASNFAAYVTPLASGGPPVETYLLWRRGVPLDRSLTMVSVRLLLTFGFFVVAVPALLLCAWPLLGLTRWLLAAAVVAVALMAASFGLFFYFLCRPPLVERLARWAFERVPLRYVQRNPERVATGIQQEVAKLNRTLRLLLRSGWAKLAALVVYTVAIWGLFFAVAPVLLLGLGVEVPWLVALTRQVILYFLFAYLPLPGASGAAEVGYASIFAAVVPKPLLAGFVAAWRFLTYYAGIAVGGPLLVRLVREPAARPAENYLGRMGQDAQLGGRP